MATLDQMTARVLIAASISAYDAYDVNKPGTCKALHDIPAPPGYHAVATFTGYDTVFGGWDTQDECYGVVFCSDGGRPSSYIFAFRGTGSLIDGIDELLGATTVPFVPFGGSPVMPRAGVESGFWSIYTSSFKSTPSMQSQVFALLQRFQPIDQLYITGHSLGGALAELFTLDVALSSRASIPYANRNYASPRVGDAAFAALYNRQSREQNPSTRTIRVQNSYDLIPCVPPEDVGFHHVGEALLVAFYNKYWYLNPTSAKYDDHSALNYQAVLNCAFARGGQCLSDALPSPVNKQTLM